MNYVRSSKSAKVYQSAVYNAGSTGTAALWGGVPVLIRAGESNAGRIGASLCAAVGLESMICQTTEEYIQQAINLAQNPHSLASLRQQLNANKEQKPLFNLANFVRELETVLQQLIARSICSMAQAKP